MDLLDRMNGAVGYIEENLDTEIDMARVARIACCSPYHFQRMFSFIADVSLAEYIRHRRLTMAALELQNSDVKVIDLAMKYGYDSHISFARAFCNFHGINPSLAREKGVKLKVCPRISFHIFVKGDVEMNYRIEEKPAISLIGKREKQTLLNEQNLIGIPAFWDRCNAKGVTQTLWDLNQIPPNQKEQTRQTGECVLGVCDTSASEGDEFYYWIAAENPDNKRISGFETFEIPAGKWAVFEAVGPMPKASQDLWKQIYTDFFPVSGYEKAKGPDMEVYFKGDNSRPDYKSEIWIPIRKK